MKKCHQLSEKKSKQSLIQKLKTRIVFLLLRKEVNEMAVVYVTLIIKGRRQLSDVPSLIRDQVKELLLEIELPGFTK